MKPARAAAWTLVVIVAYAAARWAVYRALPVMVDVPIRSLEMGFVLPDGREVLDTLPDGGKNPEVQHPFHGEIRIKEGPAQEFSRTAWFRRDAWMSIPRLAVFLACLWLMSMTGSWRSWGWHWGLRWAPASTLLLVAASFTGRWWFQAPDVPWTPSLILWGWLATIPVALAEEAAFRGLLFTGLKPALSPRKAAFLSSLAFSVYHIQAQPMMGWPVIFAFGVVFCAAAHRGIGLPWLILIHEAVDGLWFHIPTHGAFTDNVLAEAALWLLVLLVGAWAFWSPLKEDPAEGTAR